MIKWVPVQWVRSSHGVAEACDGPSSSPKLKFQSIPTLPAFWESQISSSATEITWLRQIEEEGGVQLWSVIVDQSVEGVKFENIKVNFP